jgi:hypothetical protein
MTDLIADAPRTCRTCGCTDLDCSQCITKTGRPCSWVEVDLCSACCTIDLEAIEPSIHAIHQMFGLSYARYLVVPRSVLQSMPAHWQGKMVVLLEEMRVACAQVGIELPTYVVDNSGGEKRDKLMRAWLHDYERGRRNVFAEGKVRVG